MKVRLTKRQLIQVVKQVLKQDRNPAPKGTNIRKVLKRAQNSGKRGRSWTELHNAVNDKASGSDWSNENRGNNISAINRCAGRDNGNTPQGTPEQSPYEKRPLISKRPDGNYVITKRGLSKLKQLDRELGTQE